MYGGMCSKQFMTIVRYSRLLGTGPTMMSADSVHCQLSQIQEEGIRRCHRVRRRTLVNLPPEASCSIGSAELSVWSFSSEVPPMPKLGRRLVGHGFESRVAN